MNIPLNDTRHYLNPNTLSFTNHAAKSIWWNPKQGLRIYPAPKYEFPELTFKKNTLTPEFLSRILKKNITKISPNIFQDYNKASIYFQEFVTRFQVTDYIYIWTPETQALPLDLLDIYIKYASIKR